MGFLSSSKASPPAPVVPIAKPKEAVDEKKQLQKLALISTSAQGVMGESPMGRKKLLGN